MCTACQKLKQTSCVLRMGDKGKLITTCDLCQFRKQKCSKCTVRKVRVGVASETRTKKCIAGVKPGSKAENTSDSAATLSQVIDLIRDNVGPELQSLADASNCLAMSNCLLAMQMIIDCGSKYGPAAAAGESDEAEMMMLRRCMEESGMGDYVPENLHGETLDKYVADTQAAIHLRYKRTRTREVHGSIGEFVRYLG